MHLLLEETFIIASSHITCSQRMKHVRGVITTSLQIGHSQLRIMMLHLAL